MTKSTVNITKVEENFFDKISFVNAETSTVKLENSSIDSSMIEEVQLLNVGSLLNLDKAVQKISKTSVRVPREGLIIESIKELNRIPSTLFLEFSDLEINDVIEIADFIKNYGFLYNGAKSTKELSQKARFTESIGVWAILQSELQLIIKLWRALLAHQGGFPATNALIAAGLMFNDTKPYKIKNHFSLIEDSEYPNFPLLDQQSYDIEPKDKSTQLIHIQLSMTLENKINKLIELVNPKIKFTSKRFANGRKQKRSLMSQFMGPEPTTVIHHQTLFSAILYQLLDSINDQKEYKKCLECLSWMEISKKGKEGNKYCDGTCRNKASRRRRDIELIFATRPEVVTEFQSFFKKIGEFLTQVREGQDAHLDDVFSEISKDSLGQQSGTLKKLSKNIFESYIEHLFQLVTPNATNAHFGFDRLESEEIFSKILFENLNLSWKSKALKTAYYDWSFKGYD